MTVSWRKLRAQIKGITEHYDNVLLLTSGGVDSMFLADFVINSDVKPIIVHFQHGIRENDANEARLVADLAQKHGLEFYLGKGEGLADIKGQEAAAREQRWNFVESIMLEKDGKSITITAHHLDDNIEHFYMSAARGRSVTALTMQKLMDFHSEKHPNLLYTRYKPILEIDKDEIYSQANRRNIEWFEDPTNKEMDHERNVFRNKIVPDIMEIRNIRKSMRKLFDEIEDLRDREHQDEK